MEIIGLLLLILLYRNKDRLFKKRNDSVQKEQKYKPDPFWGIVKKK